jgi:4-diphosphocytidyl-2-C-methyl-D-erythritol kinase
VRVHAPAKVNLWLDVLARRADGFHEIDTGLVALEWGDEAAARARNAPGVELSVEGPAASADVPRDGTNLAARAAALALEALGARTGIELRLTKRVPSRAGLGAGSSDAAASLLAVEAVLGRSLPESVARELLASLGSDCVFFRDAALTGFARCTGRGERVEPLDGGGVEWSVVLLVPEMGAETAKVYAELISPLSAPSAPITVRSRALHLEEPALRGMLSNGLERAALRAIPGLALWRELLDDHTGAHFRLSGSGSSFFGLFRTPQEAARCRSILDSAARARALHPRALHTTRLAGRGVTRLPDQ